MQDKATGDELQQADMFKHCGFVLHTAGDFAGSSCPQ
jgi:hypothetical protein